ncbi:unnamed protein product [Paramecium sonneborni]|uniref:HMG box domain-containing protein n=1 Tax=Paramecium sonneborni TaxID=65129 RepID=A0A8S1QS08_9CILI|nr:unnamed protein product [Paramecium sonneborni]
MQLRSGILKKPPTRNYISAYQIFYAQKFPDLKKEGKQQVSEVGHKISEMWRALDEEERQYYEDQFNEMESKYKEDLILYYGGNASDIKKYKALMEIPEKPKKPASSCLVYIAEHRKEYSHENPEFNTAKVTKNLADKYNVLPGKEKKKYEEDFQKKLEQYNKEVEIWQKKYAEKQEQFDKLIEEKFKRSVSKQDLEYQELPPYKRGPRKMKDEDETAPQKPEIKEKEVKKEEKKEEKKDEKKDDKDKLKNTKNAKDEGKGVQNKGESKKQLDKDQKDGQMRRKSGQRRY